MSSRKNTTSNFFVVKQELDDLKSQFENLKKELQQVFGIDYSGHTNTYELQLEKIFQRLDELDDKLADLHDLENLVNNIDLDNNDLRDRIRSLETNLEYIVYRI